MPMPFRFVLVAVFIAGLLAGWTCPAGQAAGERPPLRHFVALKFHDDATPEQIGHVVDSFRQLKTLIPIIDAMEMGTNISPENYNKGCTHGFILTFKSEKERDAYLAHEEHRKFKAIALPYLDDIFVLDFWGRPVGVHNQSGVAAGPDTGSAPVPGTAATVTPVVNATGGGVTDGANDKADVAPAVPASHEAN